MLHSANIPNYVHILNGIETIQLAFSILFGILTFVVFLKRSLCHRNLTIIIASLLTVYFVMIINRFVVCIYGIIDNHIFRKSRIFSYNEIIQFTVERKLFFSQEPIKRLEQLRIFGGYSSIIQVGIAVIERAIATVNMHNYEMRQHSLFLFGIIGASYVLGFYSSFIVFKCKKKFKFN